MSLILLNIAVASKWPNYLTLVISFATILIMSHTLALPQARCSL
ncbi:MAG: hypothetical protein ACJ8CB_07705 [Ktedonobacteraceae bacterium]